jgi:hypothetical protein
VQADRAVRLPALSSPRRGIVQTRTLLAAASLVPLM